MTPGARTPASSPPKAPSSPYKANSFAEILKLNKKYAFQARRHSHFDNSPLRRLQPGTPGQAPAIALRPTAQTSKSPAKKKVSFDENLPHPEKSKRAPRAKKFRNPLFGKRRSNSVYQLMTQQSQNTSFQLPSNRKPAVRGKIKAKKLCMNPIFGQKVARKARRVAQKSKAAKPPI